MNTMTITVLDTATIFEAEETIYRYDLPGTGITKGWAIDGVLEQAKNQLPDWPDVEIIIDADTEIVDILSQALTGQAVTTIPTEADSRDSDLTEPDLAESEELEPVERRFQFQWKNIALYVAMMVVAGIIGVISWQAVGNSPPVEWPQRWGRGWRPPRCGPPRRPRRGRRGRVRSCPGRGCRWVRRPARCRVS